jgi:DivIVA domain-containing protein
MDLTPRLLTEVEFREEWRGYSRRDVDDFLERVAAAVGELQERLREANERATAAERRLLERSADDDEIRRTLVLAQRTAVTAVEEARAEAERVVADADQRAREQLAEAEARLAQVEAEVAERTRRELGELSDQRATLQRDVEALQAFVAEHKGRLRAELQRQLADLDAPVPSLDVPEPPELSGLEVQLPEAPAPIHVPVPEPAAAAYDPPAPRAPTEEEVAQAREDLVEALRRAGVDDLLAVGSAQPEPEPEPEPVAEPEPAVEDPTAEAEDAPELTWAPEPEPVEEAPPAPQLYDAADESGEIALPASGDATSLYDVLADEEDDEVVAGEWEPYEPAAAGSGEDDPFLAELRRAVTDDEPLGPRDTELFGSEPDEEAVPSRRFGLRRGR